MEANIVQDLQEVNDSIEKSKNKAKLIRFGMVILKKIGFSDDTTADIFKVTRQSVAKWVKRFDKSGFVGLGDLPRSGRPRLLNNNEEKIIDNHILSAVPKEFSEQQSTGRSISVDINDLFNKKISLTSVYRILTKLEYSYSSPRPIHQKNDKIVMLNWIAKFRKEMRILNFKYKNKELEFYFQDETRYGQKTIVTKIWSKIGSDPTYTNQNGFLNTWIYGAVNPLNGNHYSLILPKLDSQNMQIFLDSFAKNIPNKKHVIMILDGSKAHKNSILKINKKISLYFLPPYSPELNPIERLWQFIKKKYLSFKIYQNIDEIIEKGAWAWGKITSNIIKSICHCNYLPNLC